MMSRRNNVETVGYAFFGVMLAVGVFCFIMAFSMTMSRPAFGNEMLNDRYEVLYKLPKKDAKITPEVCDAVTQTAGFIKGMMDKGADDTEISVKLSEAALANPGDRAGWVAYHMVVDPDALANMREWPKEASYEWMQRQFPDFSDREYYQLYAGTKCDQSVGKTVKVLKVKHIVK
jgi:hypothetical protein